MVYYIYQLNFDGNIPSSKPKEILVDNKIEGRGEMFSVCCRVLAFVRIEIDYKLE